MKKLALMIAMVMIIQKYSNPFVPATFVFVKMLISVISVNLLHLTYSEISKFKPQSNQIPGVILLINMAPKIWFSW